MKLNLLLTIAISISFISLHAQNSTQTSGGNATGNGGTVSYTVGQVVYNTHSATNGSVSEGVQQAYEISVILGIDEPEISLNISAFPNPATDFLILKIVDDAFHEMEYSLTLYNIYGQVIMKQLIIANETKIELAALRDATYFLNVKSGILDVKTFKIIKN